MLLTETQERRGRVKEEGQEGRGNAEGGVGQEVIERRRTKQWESNECGKAGISFTNTIMFEYESCIDFVPTTVYSNLKYSGESKKCPEADFPLKLYF